MGQNGTISWVMKAEAAAQEAGAVPKVDQEADLVAGAKDEDAPAAGEAHATKALILSQNANAPSKSLRADGQTKHSTPT